MAERPPATSGMDGVREHHLPQTLSHRALVRVGVALGSPDGSGGDEERGAAGSVASV